MDLTVQDAQVSCPMLSTGVVRDEQVRQQEAIRGREKRGAVSMSSWVPVSCSCFLVSPTAHPAQCSMYVTGVTPHASPEPKALTGAAEGVWNSFYF